MARHDIQLLFVLIATISVVALASENCHYTISVKTGSRHDSGTDAVIGIVLADRSGKYIEIKNLPGWYAAYVDVKTTKTGTPSKYQHFTVEQWLANSEPPYLLYAERDNCPSVIKKSPYSIV
uniref:PLAT domain-containing protein n=1 Tax=Brassica campestris TaxID=3711 RepID=M4FFR7_BRACM